jgi:nucleoid-associated protein YgaU
VRAQDQSVVERVNRLGVYVEELLAERAQMKKQISDLTREVESLREQLSAAQGGATPQEMESLANSIREVDRKRQKDREMILDEIDKLGNKLGSRASSGGASAPTPTPSRDGYEYTVQSGDTLSAIVEAYRREGVKVTVNDVLKANPGLKPESIRIGQKVFIPKP